jgi:hypothetical protein
MKATPPKLSVVQVRVRRLKWRNLKRQQRAKLTPNKKEAAERRSLGKRLNSLMPEDLELLLMNTTPRRKKTFAKKGSTQLPKECEETVCGAKSG